jgi:hypothetical protein
MYCKKKLKKRMRLCLLNLEPGFMTKGKPFHNGYMYEIRHLLEALKLKLSQCDTK